MDPVAVFNALYDTKCLKFGQFDLKSGLVAPYYINLRRLPLYPNLMDAVVNQVVDKFLSSQALGSTTSQLKKQMSLKSAVKQALQKSIELDHEQQGRKYSKGSIHRIGKIMSPSESDADSQLEEDEPDSPSEHSDDRPIYPTDRSEPMISGVPYGAIPLAALIAGKAQLPYLFERKDTKDHGDPQSLLEDFQSESGKQPSVILIEDVICSGESILEAVKSLEAKNLKVEFVICIVDRELNGAHLLLEQAGIHVLSLYNISAILRILEATGRISSDQFIETRQWMSNNQFRSIGSNLDSKISQKCSPTKSTDSDTTPTKQNTNVAHITVAAS